MDKDDKKIEEVLNKAGGDFSMFVTSLSMQALVSLGEIPNPADGKKESSPAQAKYIIDTLGMLSDKTKGNLTESENNIMEQTLYHLRMQYMELTKDKPKDLPADKSSTDKPEVKG